MSYDQKQEVHLNMEMDGNSIPISRVPSERFMGRKYIEHKIIHVL